MSTITRCDRCSAEAPVAGYVLNDLGTDVSNFETEFDLCQACVTAFNDWMTGALVGESDRPPAAWSPDEAQRARAEFERANGYKPRQMRAQFSGIVHDETSNCAPMDCKPCETTRVGSEPTDVTAPAWFAESMREADRIDREARGEWSEPTIPSDVDVELIYEDEPEESPLLANLRRMNDIGAWRERVKERRFVNAPPPLAAEPSVSHHDETRCSFHPNHRGACSWEL